LILPRYAREQVFKVHPLVSHLAETLLHVFVSIEMTGQAVQFEQKFNYRRPMYLILDYIWEIEEHQNAIQVRPKKKIFVGFRSPDRP
jgi:ubiquitin conjugation factor E4 A